MDGRLIEHELGGVRLLGYSVAGEESVIAAPELNVCFDVGKAPSEILAIDHVLLSHGHMDHSAGIAYYFSQRNFVGNEGGTVIVPPSLVDPLRDLMRVWGSIEGHVSPAKIVGLEPGQKYAVRRGLDVHAFAPNHGVDALGFCVVDVRHKLKPEYADRTGPELAAMKKEGVQIQYDVEVPLVAYCGDTAEGDWLTHDLVKTAKVLIIECTFFEADHVKRARAGYHMHVKDVARLLPQMKNEHIVVAHVSRRTGMRDAKKAMAKLVDEETMSRVKFLMDGRRYRPHRQRPKGNADAMQNGKSDAKGGEG